MVRAVQTLAIDNELLSGQKPAFKAPGGRYMVTEQAAATLTRPQQHYDAQPALSVLFMQLEESSGRDDFMEEDIDAFIVEVSLTWVVPHDLLPA